MRYCILLCFLVVSLSATAQKKLKSGTIKYQITNVKSDKMGTSMLQGTNLNLYFDGDLHKMEIVTMMGMVNLGSVTDIGKKSHITLMNLMGKKIKVVEDKLPAPKKKNVFTITYDKKATKEIAGYPCYKATMTSKSGTVLTAYVTDKVKAKNKYFEEVFHGLKGWPMEYTIKNKSTEMTFLAQSVKKDLNKNVFLIPDDYEEKTPEEMKQMLGGFNLGM